MSSTERSRPLRAAAEISGRDEQQLGRRFAGQRVSIRCECEVDEDGREAFLYSVNQVLRFCSNVSIAIPRGADHLAAEAQELVERIVGTGAILEVVKDDPSADVTLVIGTDVLPERQCVAVTSNGWVACMTTSAAGVGFLPRLPATPNPIGALGAACLGVSQVFHVLAGNPLKTEAVEVSLFERTNGVPGTHSAGPPLPSEPLKLDALLVGCGGVMHGFAYALKRLPVVGKARAVDRQRLRLENLGPYVLAWRDLVDVEKAQILRDALAPAIAVTPYPEDFDPLFTVRLERGHFPLPPIVVAGLDRVTTRHTVQRVWPEVLIDMGAGGETAQVILKRRKEPGMCVVEALAMPPGEAGDIDRLAEETGLSVAAIREMDTPVSAEDVAVAPPHRREALETARQAGQLRCGFIRSGGLDHEEPDEGFAAAAPFVVAYTGVVAAAELVKELMGLNAAGSMRYQLSFASGRGKAVSLPAARDCECVEAQRTAA